MGEKKNLAHDYNHFKGKTTLFFSLFSFLPGVWLYKPLILKKMAVFSPASSDHEVEHVAALG